MLIDTVNVKRFDPAPEFEPSEVLLTERDVAVQKGVTVLDFFYAPGRQPAYLVRVDGLQKSERVWQRELYPETILAYWRDAMARWRKRGEKPESDPRKGQHRSAAPLSEISQIAEIAESGRPLLNQVLDLTSVTSKYASHTWTSENT